MITNKKLTSLNSELNSQIIIIDRLTESDS